MKSLYALILGLLITQNSYAAFYLEPYVGYESGTNEGTYDIGGAGTIDADISGNVFGAKIGFSKLGTFAAGIDFSKGSYDSEDNTTPPDDDEVDTTDVGLFVQVTLPLFLKFSATYFISSEAEGEDADYSGSGYKVGVGFTMLPLVSINVDMINVNYDDAEVPGSTVTAFDVDRETIMVSISLPLDI